MYMRLIQSFKSEVTHEFCRVDEYNTMRNDEAKIITAENAV